ncbi:MAG: hypothetical protein ING77_15305 [Rhodocyclaceae bacterium]|nr:hypothetical protein [Rhodocyclaceae bacterium]MCA3848842.1 hypothetical protein [Burkholderia sp.]MCA3104305.1 hypothetical protein [Rhodocyclaceae bacterium]MCA3120998.1 hypothetical protein [Rhodocyclaceae bacterium]MCA3124953.1 hypothetical protein [Rhodocyclaceae bacterium]
MNTKTAKLFNNGGSQAVRLPAEFRFTSADLRNELLSTRPLNEPLRSRVLSEDD